MYMRGRVTCTWGGGGQGDMYVGGEGDNVDGGGRVTCT